MLLTTGGDLPLIYEAPVCPVCLPEHRPSCPRMNYYVFEERLQRSVPCQCPERLQMLKTKLPPEPVEETRDHLRERELEVALRQEDTSVLTEESWRGSGNMGGRKFILSIVALLWPLEFNWYILRRENQRRWRLHDEHQKICSNPDKCADVHHLAPECPPEHAWMPSYRSFTTEVLRAKAEDPRWEELACWRADLTYWVERLPWDDKRLFLYRLNDKELPEIARLMGWTRAVTRKRLQRLSFFLRHAADSQWDQRKALLALIGVIRLGVTPEVTSAVEGGELNASNRRTSQGDSSSLAEAASA